MNESILPCLETKTLTLTTSSTDGLVLATAQGPGPTSESKVKLASSAEAAEKLKVWSARVRDELQKRETDASSNKKQKGLETDDTATNPNGTEPIQDTARQVAKGDEKPIKRKNPEDKSAKEVHSEAKKRKNTESGQSTQENGNEQYIGCRVAKYFDGHIFFGTVEIHTDGYWHVKYDDSDREDFDNADLKRALELYRKMEAMDVVR